MDWLENKATTWFSSQSPSTAWHSMVSWLFFGKCTWKQSIKGFTYWMRMCYKLHSQKEQHPMPCGTYQLLVNTQIDLHHSAVYVWAVYCYLCALPNTKMLIEFPISVLLLYYHRFWKFCCEDIDMVCVNHKNKNIRNILQWITITVKIFCPHSFNAVHFHTHGLTAQLHSY